MAIETVQSLGKEDEKIFERKSDGDWDSTETRKGGRWR